MTNPADQTCRPSYLYQAVVGASLWSGQTTMRKARQKVCALRVRYPLAEVERVLALQVGGAHYWRWRGGRWRLETDGDPSAADLAKWDFAPAIAEIANAIAMLVRL